MDDKVLQGLVEQSNKEKIDLKDLLKEYLDREKEKEKILIKVQIMPFNTIAGFGSFPSVVSMPLEKALDLARWGKVNILKSYKDIIKEDDEEAIDRYQQDMLLVRKSKDGERLVRESSYTNIEIPKEYKGEEELVGVLKEERGEEVSQRRRMSRSTFQ